MHNRRQSREIVFGLVYELDFNREYDIEELYANALEEREIEENDFIRGLFFGVAEKLEEIDSLIRAKSEGWNLDRISRVSRAAMRLCIYEMKWADTPMNTSAPTMTSAKEPETLSRLVT